MFSKVKNDLPASLVVFLVALPLCLGVALASGAPLLSGVISGIVGGIVVGLLSGSHTSVSGPAAGLAVIVLSSINKLGSFDVFLLAVVLAGIFQLIGGIIKTGFIADYIPSNVIKGLLASIGVTLIFKQIPHAVGLDRNAIGDFNFLQSDGENTFSELLNIFDFFNWGAVIIAFVSLFVLIGFDKTPLKKITFLPSSLIVVLLGLTLNGLFEKFLPYFYIDKEHLVSIPKIDSISDFISLPSFSSITNYNVWVVAFTIAVIASLETLLNLEAVEDIDPHKRKASPNRELIAQGVGNIFSGLLGGIPITSVIVRSSVNINAGGQTKLSAILHGVFLLVSVLFISQILNMIPLASLAAILLVTGYKLAKWDLFKGMYQKGLDQFIPFFVTIIAILFTDLLIGILIGLTISIFHLLKSNYKNPFVLENEHLNTGETLRMELSNQVSFLNKATIKETLWLVPNDSKVIIDATYSDFIDNDVLELIEDFKTTVSVERNIQLNIIGLKDKYKLDDHIQFVNVIDKETQEKLQPSEILDILRKGNERFTKGKWVEKYFKHQVNVTSFGQNPMAVIISCMDSRTSPEIIFDLGLGDIFSIRIAGNIINKEILGSVEFACKKMGVKLIVVLGHSKCGAITSAIQSITSGNIGSITSKIEKSIVECNCDRHTITEDSEIFDTIVKNNTKNSISEILKESEYLANKLKNNEISIVSGFHDTTTGLVMFDEV